MTLIGGSWFIYRRVFYEWGFSRLYMYRRKNDFIHFLHSNTNACINNKNINPIHDEIIKLKLGLKGSSIDQLNHLLL